MSACNAPSCTAEAAGYFCTAHWKELPWDKRAALTTAAKTGNRRKEALQYAIDWFAGKSMESGEK